MAATPPHKPPMSDRVRVRKNPQRFCQHDRRWGHGGGSKRCQHPQKTRGPAQGRVLRVLKNLKSQRGGIGTLEAQPSPPADRPSRGVRARTKLEVLLPAMSPSPGRQERPDDRGVVRDRRGPFQTTCRRGTCDQPGSSSSFSHSPTPILRQRRIGEITGRNTDPRHPIPVGRNDPMTAPGIGIASNGKAPAPRSGKTVLAMGSSLPPAGRPVE